MTATGDIKSVDSGRDACMGQTWAVVDDDDDDHSDDYDDGGDVTVP